MITREQIVPPGLDRVSTSVASFPAFDRFGRWVATKGWIHILLITGVIGCLYPLLWMFMMSLKTDDELARNEIVPALPVFRDHSPYVRDPVPVEKPDDVGNARFEAILPTLRELSASLTRAALPTRKPSSVDGDEWAASAASALMNRTLATMPKHVWDEGSDAVVNRFHALITRDAVDTALSSQLARVELSTLTLRTLDGRMFDLSKGRVTEGWRVVRGAGSLVSENDVLRLDYGFGGSGDEPIVLQNDFDLPEGVTGADIHKVIVALRADESWHGVDATIDVGKTHWSTSRSTFLVQNRAQSLSFQPPTYDDTTIRARTWIPLRADGMSDHDRNARLSLIVSPSSRARAIVAKIERNYVRAFDSVPFFRYVANSLLLVGLTILGSVFSSAFVAYAFARLSWPGRSVALVLLLATMMVPAQVTMIPSFLVWKSVGWYNTLTPMWVPAWLGNPFFIFLMIQHMRTIPRELEEAARIDGLGVVRTWWYIIVPLLKPTLAAIAVMTFLGSWNEFMGPLIYLRDQAKFPLSLGLFGMRIDHGADWSMLMAANVLMTVPSLFVFFCFQRYLIEGVAVTGMKG